MFLIIHYFIILININKTTIILDLSFIKFEHHINLNNINNSKLFKVSLSSLRIKQLSYI